MHHLKRVAIFGLLFILGAAGRIEAEWFIVTSSEDSGPGTLREAVAAANTTTGIQTIGFSVANSITVYSPLMITDTILMEGRGTTLGSTGTNVIELYTGSDGSWVKNLAIVSGDIGVQIDGQNNRVSGCALGTDWSNGLGRGNYHGIKVTGNNNLIGGDSTLGQGNILSGNRGSGIFLQGSGNSVCGNIIGLNSLQNLAVPNSNYGVYLYNASANQVGLPQAGWGNIISGNAGSGIYFDSDADRNYVQNNVIGLSATSQCFPNSKYGINMFYGTGNLIGGTQNPPGLQKNIISGNTLAEINLDWDSNTITGNFIGTNAAGTAVLPGAPFKIYMESGFTHNLIGLPQTGSGNLIAGGNYGVYLAVFNSDNNGIYGNTICAFNAGGIYLGPGANNDKPAPILTFANQAWVQGTAAANDYIEVFKAEARPAARGGSLQWLGWALADSNGQWLLPVSGVVAGDYVCATASDSGNNTSVFSVNLQVLNATPTPTITVTSTITVTPTLTATVTPTSTFSPTMTPTSTPTPTITQTCTISATATISATITPTPTITETETASPTTTISKTPTTTPTITQTATVTPTATITPTATPTPSITVTASASPTATSSPTMSATPTATQTATNTLTATPTFTPSPTPTCSPTTSLTPTSTLSSTVTPTSTVSLTATPTPTITATATASLTATSTATPRTWQPLGGSLNMNPGKQAHMPKLAVTDQDVPYVVWVEEDAGGARQVHVKHFDGAQWVSDGSQLSVGDSQTPDIALSQNQPSVSWYENNRIYVKTLQAGSWQSLDGYVDQFCTDPTLALSSTTPCVGYVSGTSAMVKGFDGTAWVLLGAAVNQDLGGNASQPRIASYSGIPYVAWWNRDGTRYSVLERHFEDSHWQQDGSSLNFTNTFISDVAITMCGAIPYVAWSENGAAYVKHLAGSGWVLDGSSINQGLSTVSALALDHHGRTPYAAMCGYGAATNYYNRVFLQHFDGQNWIQDGGYANLSATTSVTNFDLGIADSAYLAWEEAGQIYVKKMGLPAADPLPLGPTATATLTPVLQTLTATETATPQLDLHGKQVMVWPVPARNVLYFGWSQANVERVKVDVFNLSGERVAELHGDQPGQTLAWDLSGRAPGIYFYQVTIFQNGSGHKLPVGKLAILR